jgi:predicted short-subunit dehydrogenase-like oxidoreductase (DUF2520 family)
LAFALGRAGWDVAGLLGRADDISCAAEGVDLLVISTPDDAIAGVAASVRSTSTTAVVHLSGALGLDVLAPHPRRGGLHPLVPLPDPVVGSDRLASGITFAVAGDPLSYEVVACLGGHAVVLDDRDRPLYHAAACIASNHLVALLGQVERVAEGAGLPLEVFLGLARSALDDVARVGPRRALTGPAARGDVATLARHREAIPAGERPGYDAGVALAVRLAGRGDTGEPASSVRARAVPAGVG